jgi:hypothetical protein
MLKRWTYKTKQGAKNTSSPISDDYNVWVVEHLRKECTARGFQLARDISKEDRMKRLTAHDEMHDKLMDQGVQDNALLPTQQTGTVRTKHCMFRLLNVLFHDKHIADFMKLGDTLTKYDLDTRKVGLDGKSLFWNEIHEGFVDDASVEYDVLLAEEHIAFEDINPALIVEHSLVKLQDMWRDLNGRYKKAKINFTKSGTADSDFWNFCNGQADVYYLWNMLQTRQEATSFVDGGMLDDDCYDSMTTKSSKRDADAASSGGSRGSYRKQQKQEDDQKRDAMLDSIRLFAESSTVAAKESAHSEVQSRELHNMELDKGLMSNLEQAMKSLDGLKQRLKDEEDKVDKDEDEIAEINDAIDFYKSKRKQILTQLRR